MGYRLVVAAINRYIVLSGDALSSVKALHGVTRQSAFFYVSEARRQGRIITTLPRPCHNIAYEIWYYYFICFGF